MQLGLLYKTIKLGPMLSGSSASELNRYTRLILVTQHWLYSRYVCDSRALRVFGHLSFPGTLIPHASRRSGLACVVPSQLLALDSS